MRILYIDIDTLRPDHLGCYGYHRDTSPAIDRLAHEGIRFQNVYASDAPRLPSRTALFSGRYGIHTGVVDHGGVAADPFIEGPDRGFRSTLGHTCWMSGLRGRGYWTATISPFAERHSAWWFCAGFNEIVNTGKGGNEIADDVEPVAMDWHGEALRTATHPQDPLWTVMQAGGPEHTRGCLPGYLRRLRESGRDQWADRLAQRHAKEAAE